MDKQKFIETAAALRAEVIRLLSQVNLDEKFDITDPILLVVCEEESKPVLRLFNTPDMDIIPTEMVLMMFRDTLKHALTMPETNVVAAMTLTSGWTKDPDTMERGAEIVAITLEDPDRNTYLLKWDMERVEGEPVRLINETEVTAHDYSYEQHGRFQNLFELPPKEMVN